MLEKEQALEEFEHQVLRPSLAVCKSFLKMMRARRIHWAKQVVRFPGNDSVKMMFVNSSWDEKVWAKCASWMDQ